MAIIRHTKDETIRYAYLNIFPDQFKTTKEKEDDSYIKNTMDYFSNKGYSEYIKNNNTFVKNYDLMNGILRMADFYQDTEIKSFTDVMTDDLALPAHVKHYSIVTAPINSLIGEITKRPDTYKTKAFDDDSKAQELQAKTEILMTYITQQAKEHILIKMKESGEEIPSDDEVNKMTMAQVQDELDSYSSVAEKWSNHVLTCNKADFNMKEKSEEAFRDLCITSREFFHIYADNSKLGFNVEVANPKNVWQLTTPDKKYVSDVTGRAQGAYAAGTVMVMEFSEIMEAFPDLTKDEIDHLRSSMQDFGLINTRESNLGNPNAGEGTDTIKYDTFDPLVLQTRMIVESSMKENNDGLQDFLGLTSNVSAFGYKYVVVRAYWMSKKKIGNVVYLDEMGIEQAMMVDETYKSGIIPTQVSLTWGWANQWYEGVKIGPDIYHMKPFDLLPYCPIIGTVHNQKNTEARSILDLMKPFQVMYNICMNQLYKLLEKEIGNVASINIRRVPVPKDGDAQDALDIWELEARERGIIFDDDSPENTKAPVSNTTIARNIDLTRSNEIQSRYNLAIQLKQECWELIGMSKQRMGSVAASETATGTQQAMQSSYVQTEPLFVAHEYVLGQFYQAIIDASLYIECTKPESTLSYINSEGTSSFVKVNGSDLRFRDLKVFLTNRPEDIQMFNEIRALAQPLMQNGGSLYDVIELYSTKSLREMKKVFKELRDQQIQERQTASDQQQQQINANKEAQAASNDTAQKMQENLLAHQDYQNELDRINKKEVAVINALSRNENATADTDGTGVADALEITNMANEKERSDKDFSAKMLDIQNKNKIATDKNMLELNKLQVARENMVNDLAVAKQNSVGRNKSK
jgi:hypothetical protein